LHGQAAHSCQTTGGFVVKCATRASMKHVGGAGIEGQDLLWLGGTREHRYVAMPPRLREMRPSFLVAVEKIVCVRNQRRACPRRAMSADEKSPTVVMPVRAAITDGSPI